MTPARPRVGAIGIRRRRTGVGAFVVRDLVAAGADVPCFLATADETRDAGARELAERFGIEARGYTDLDRMLDSERLDALAILGPAETHAAHLEAAADAGLHALCEKPFVWGAPDLARKAADLAARFDRRGLLLWENCQWPYALPSFEALHPGALGKPPSRFEMRLQPAGRGVDMLGDSMPHVLSVLQALAPDPAPTVSSVRFSADAPDPPAVGEAPPPLRVEFAYRTRAADVRARAILRRTDAHPRECALVIDGREARREVGPDYALAFSAGDRSVPLPDPMTRLVTSFVTHLRGPRATRSAEIATRAALLDAIVAAPGAPA